MSYVLVILGVLLVMALWLRWNEPRMLYYPTRAIAQTPDQLGLPYEDVSLTAGDSVRLNGWFLPAPAARGPTPHAPAVTVLFLHGNAGNISHRFEKLAVLRGLGVDAFILDYRGYGRSEGRPSEAGTYLDARAAYEYLTQQRRIGPAQIVVYGESLGSAVAVDLAARFPTGGVVLEEAFTSIADVGQKMFPFLPVRLLVRNKYDTLSKISRINAPLLLIHSRDDEFFSYRHAERLFAAARDPKRLVELRGGHNDAFLVSAGPYHRALQGFFQNPSSRP